MRLSGAGGATVDEGVDNEDERVRVVMAVVT